jgi:hypothetical protein
MDKMMDRLDELKSFSSVLANPKSLASALTNPAGSSAASKWIAESFVKLVAEKYGIAIKAMPGLHVHVKRFENSAREKSGSNP